MSNCANGGRKECVMESIDKLRNAGERIEEDFRYGKNVLSAINVCNAIADEIEREIAEKYMELPVDADGVPIHEGDVIQFVNEQGGTGAHVEVDAVSKYYAYYGEGKHFYKASMCRHVKPDPLKELLSELANDVCEASCTCQTTWSDSGLDGIEERYAERIRELLGGDAE